MITCYPLVYLSCVDAGLWLSGYMKIICGHYDVTVATYSYWLSTLHMGVCVSKRLFCTLYKVKLITISGWLYNNRSTLKTLSHDRSRQTAYTIFKSQQKKNYLYFDLLPLANTQSYMVYHMQYLKYHSLVNRVSAFSHVNRVSPFSHVFRSRLKTQSFKHIS